ncbi:hypothetical protein FA95DRAFT_1612757 [Auriscalpium vulgare]|uniref:Uncharacterized protein n=1 Tax=Auriscalpium vulgare TaxID=40419 RepID=A0ACB8R517_9AGAM|nr:hypothetical protein FA95DRAFT_1612757 [Auriscalpium vulgare]
MLNLYEKRLLRCAARVDHAVVALTVENESAIKEELWTIMSDTDKIVKEAQQKKARTAMHPLLLSCGLALSEHGSVFSIVENAKHSRLLGVAGYMPEVIPRNMKLTSYLAALTPPTDGSLEPAKKRKRPRKVCDRCANGGHPCVRRIEAPAGNCQRCEGVGITCTYIGLGLPRGDSQAPLVIDVDALSDDEPARKRAGTGTSKKQQSDSLEGRVVRGGSAGSRGPPPSVYHAPTQVAGERMQALNLKPMGSNRPKPLPTPGEEPLPTPGEQPSGEGSKCAAVGGTLPPMPELNRITALETQVAALTMEQQDAASQMKVIKGDVQGILSGLRGEKEARLARKIAPDPLKEIRGILDSLRAETAAMLAAPDSLPDGIQHISSRRANAARLARQTPFEAALTRGGMKSAAHSPPAGYSPAASVPGKGRYGARRASAVDPGGSMPPPLTGKAEPPASSASAEQPARAEQVAPLLAEEAIGSPEQGRLSASEPVISGGTSNLFAVAAATVAGACDPREPSGIAAAGVSNPADACDADPGVPSGVAKASAAVFGNVDKRPMAEVAEGDGAETPDPRPDEGEKLGDGSWGRAAANRSALGGHTGPAIGALADGAQPLSSGQAGAGGGRESPSAY